MIKRTEEEIEEQIELAMGSGLRGKSDFPGLTYEEGISEALRWVIGDIEVPPLETKDKSDGK